MQAAEFDRYGDSDGLAVRDVPDPVPAREELLVRIRAAALNPKDIVVRRGKYRLFTGNRFPQRIAYDWAGEVVQPDAAGRYSAGQRLYGMIQSWKAGACAQLAAVLPDQCAPMPPGLDFQQAAALPLAALTALQALRDLAHVGAGHAVLINGASGGVGTLAIQIARCLGASVTTLSGQANLDLCRELGADQALDYRVDQPLQRHLAWDCVFDVFGNRSFAHSRQALKPGGTYVSTIPSVRGFLDVARTMLARRRAKIVVVRSRRPDLEQLTAWVQEGRLKPIVDRVVPLAQIREAQDYLATKHARGKIVLSIP